LKSKLQMSKEVEKYFVDRLSAILTDYLQDFSQNNVAKVNVLLSYLPNNSFL